MAWKTAAPKIGSTPLKNDGVRQTGSSQLLGKIKKKKHQPGSNCSGDLFAQPFISMLLSMFFKQTCIFLTVCGAQSR